jgi:RNA polymerase sigma-70 factor (ECF subfamily)
MLVGTWKQSVTNMGTTQTVTLTLNADSSAALGTVFTAHLLERVPPQGGGSVSLDHSEAVAHLRASDLFLACACAKGDPRALKHFEAHFMNSVDAALARMRLSPHTVEEIKQEVRQRLLVGERGQCPRIADYSGEGALRSWVYAAAVRTALNWIKANRRHVPDEHEQLMRIPADGDDPELAALRARYADAFAAAFRDAFSTLPARQRLLLKQHYVDGLSTEDIGKLFRAHRVTVLRWLTRARDELTTRLEQALMERLGLRPDEYDSIVRLVRSQLDVSIGPLLR